MRSREGLGASHWQNRRLVSPSLHIIIDVEPEILDHDELDALRQLLLDPLLRGKL